MFQLAAQTYSEQTIQCEMREILPVHSDDDEYLNLGIFTICKDITPCEENCVIVWDFVCVCYFWRAAKARSIWLTWSSRNTWTRKSKSTEKNAWTSRCFRNWLQVRQIDTIQFGWFCLLYIDIIPERTEELSKDLDKSNTNFALSPEGTNANLNFLNERLYL